jgi:NADPH:quinone reductase-like Zn-dependent oxidoreductase
MGIDVAYEGVGGTLRDAVLDNLSDHGRLLVVGYISEYPHARPDGWKAPSSKGLPPSHELFWKRQTVRRGSQTIYGDVWSGVGAFLPCCSKGAMPLMAIAGNT